MKCISFLFLSFLFNNCSLLAQSEFHRALADSALTLTKQDVLNDPAYVRIKYPGGDVPAGTGVCTDVVIRANRKMGIDLQKEVHEDMKAHFNAYPKNWNLKSPDSNIDHRRVPNLMTYFKRKGAELLIRQEAAAFKAGDIVTWDLGGGISHIGIVSAKKTSDEKRLMIIHNIGAGQVLQDCLFSYRIIGHYRFKI